MKKAFLLPLLVLLANTCWAQPNIQGKIFGIVVDGLSKNPVEYATVSVKHLKDTIFISGSLTDVDGKFELDQLKPGVYIVETSFLGYASRFDTVKLVPSGKPEMVADMGKVVINEDALLTDEVVVTAERAQLTLNIDKKVFEVAKTPVATGGTALDVLRQVPTLNVDIDGKLSLRGSENLIIYINGRPSSLNGENRAQILEQIPANTIQRVELITNPSARYDAEGMTGILNIITNQKIKTKGITTVTATYATLDKFSLGVSNSFRKGKWGMSNNLSYRNWPIWNEGYNNRKNIVTNTGSGRDSIYSINSVSNGKNFQQSLALSGNADYSIDNKNTLSINYLGSLNLNPAEDNYRYSILDSLDRLVEGYNRLTDEDRSGYNVDVNLNWRRSEGREKPEFVLAGAFSYTYDFVNARYREILDNNYTRQTQYNDIQDKFLTSSIQADYIHPLKNGFKFEVGGKTQLRDLINDFKADSLDRLTNLRVADLGLTNLLGYKENINAMYGVFSGKVGKLFDFLTGLRVENTNIWLTQAVGDYNGTKHYLTLFPSVFISKKLPLRQELQVSFSRRINRPGSQSLNPFPNLTDPLNVRVGNPDLNPEIIDAYELNYQKLWDDHNIVATLYFRQVNNYIQRVRDVQGDTSTLRMQNLDYSRNFGLELTFRNTWTKWWNTLANVNVYRNQLFGNNTELQAQIAAINFNYNIRFTSNFKLLKNLDLQASVNYTGRNTLPQGSWEPVWFVDSGIRWSFAKGRGSLNLNVSDIFDTRQFQVITFNLPNQDTRFEGDFVRKRESRIANLTFSWRFGDGKAASTEKKRTPSEFSGGFDGGM